MEYRNLGNSGLKVSAVGLGCNNFGMRCDAEQTRAVVLKALDEGITLFDTADIYGNRGGSEELLGKALGNRRREIIVATKFGMAMGDGPYMKGGSQRYIMAAAEASLKRLGTDYIDLYQIHQPDPETPQHETLEALNDLVRAGKVRYIGHSNFSGWQTADAHWISRTRGLASYISAQNLYNLLDRRIERELVPACREFGVGILPYFPLASGFFDRQIQARRRAAKRHAAFVDTADGEAGAHRREFCDAREARKVRARSRSHNPRACRRMARVAAAGFERNFRSHQRRPGHAKRESRQLETVSGRTRRSRQTHAPLDVGLATWSCITRCDTTMSWLR